MKTFRRLPALIILTTVFVFAATPAFGQGPAIDATVDRATVSTDDVVVLTVTVDTGKDQQSQPQLPALDGFRVLTTSSGRQLVVVNGATTAQTTYQFRLQPLRAGSLTIPPFSTTVDGQVYSTEPIAVSVTQGSGQSQPASPSGSSAPGMGQLPPLFDPSIDPQDLINQLDQWMQSQMPGLAQMPASAAAPAGTPIQAPDELNGQDYYAEASVDKIDPYEGEQVVYTLRLYRAVNPFGTIEYQAPGFTGFWSKQQEGQRDFSTEAAGRGYLVSEIETVLFPTVSGKVTIDPATFTVPGDFFGPGTVVKSRELTLEVKPLPADAPASFAGAVGRFTLEAKADKTQAKVGDAVTQRIMIGGVGNLETMADPELPDSPAWRAFDGESKTDSQFKGGLFGGTRSISRMVVPTQAGTLSLPAIEFSYFDPTQGRYETLRSEPIAVVVAPSADPAGSAASSGATQSQDAPAPVQSLTLRPIKLDLMAESSLGDVSLPHQPAFWLLWTLPVALVAGQAVWQRRQNHLSTHGAAFGGHKASKQAQKSLDAARRNSSDPHVAAHAVVVEFIGAKLRRPVAGLTQRELTDLLLARGISPKLVARVQAILTQSEVARYAPESAFDAQADLLGETAQVIDELDRAME